MRVRVISILICLTLCISLIPLLAPPVVQFGDSSLTFDITTACLGGLLFWVYVALVMAESGTTRRQRLAGLVVGVVALLAFNLFRIATSVHLEWRTGVNVHNYFYFFNMVFVLLVWAGWVRTLRSRPMRVAQIRSQQTA